MYDFLQNAIGCQDQAAFAAAEQTETSDGDAKERQRGRFRNRGRSAGAGLFDDRDIIEAVRVVWSALRNSIKVVDPEAVNVSVGI
jgi:hypothetical protein